MLFVLMLGKRICSTHSNIEKNTRNPKTSKNIHAQIQKSKNSKKKYKNLKNLKKIERKKEKNSAKSKKFLKKRKKFS